MTNSVKPSKVTRSYRLKSADDWKVLVKQCDESELSIAEFCQENNIAASGLYSWRKRFAGKDSATEGGEFVELTPPLQSSSFPSEQTQDKTWDIELVLGKGCTLRIRAA